MYQLVDILMIVSVLSLISALCLATYVLIACLLRNQEVSKRFFSSRRFLPIRIVRFFSKRRYVDTMEPRLVRLGEATLYLSRASMFFIGVTALLVALSGQ
jgi:hypothetical protein